MRKRAIQLLTGLAAAAILTVLIVSCGKKADPLPPLVIVPKSPSEDRVTQSGDLMVYSFLMPTINTDGKTPPNISKIEVYKLIDPRIAVPQTQTGQTQTQTQTAPQTQTQWVPQSQTQWQPQSQLQTQSQPQSQTQTQSRPQSQPQSQTQPQTAPAPEEARKIEEDEFKSRSVKLIEITADQIDGYVRDGYFIYTDKINTATDSPDFLNWSYFGAKIYNQRGQSVGYTDLIGQYPAVVPKAPANFTATYDEAGIHLAWTAVTTDIHNKPITGTVTYSIFRGNSADFAPMKAINNSDSASTSTNNTSSSNTSSSTTFTDTSFEMGRPYYYFVRAQISTQKKQSSAPSNVILMFPQDTFPPSAPQELNAVAAKEGMVLIWAPNPETDVAGFNVYRSETSGTGYVKLNTDLIRETTFSDTTAKPGRKYYYVVSAVDNAPVPNEGKRSDEVSEVMRK